MERRGAEEEKEEFRSAATGLGEGGEDGQVDENANSNYQFALNFILFLL